MDLYFSECRLKERKQIQRCSYTVCFRLFIYSIFLSLFLLFFLSSSLSILLAFLYFFQLSSFIFSILLSIFYYLFFSVFIFIFHFFTFSFISSSFCPFLSFIFSIFLSLFLPLSLCIYFPHRWLALLNTPTAFLQIGKKPTHPRHVSLVWINNLMVRLMSGNFGQCYHFQVKSDTW